MSLSGSGISNISINNFSCADQSTIDQNDITDGIHWMIRGEIIRGKIPYAIVLSVLCITALVWNLFIMVTYCYKFQLLKEPGNIFLFGLALTDFIFSIAIIPMSVVTVASTEFNLGRTDQVRCDACYVQGFLIAFCPTVSVTILAVLSVDRCYLLSNPLVYKKRKSWLFALLTLVLVFIVCVLFCIPPAFGFGQWEFNRNIAVCLPRFTPRENAVYMAFLVLYTLIPIGLLAVTNIWTYKIVSRFFKRKLVRRRSYRGSIKQRKEDSSQHQHQQSQLVKVFGALFIANIVTWSPIIVMVFVVAAFGGDFVPPWLYVIFWILVASNTVVHPIIESLFNKELRVTVNKGKRKVNSTVRSASKSLIRMATMDSFKSMPTMPDIPELATSTKGKNVDYLNTTATDVEWESERSSSSPVFCRSGQNVGSSTPECTKTSEVEGLGRLRKVGTVPSPLINRHTSPVFNYPEDGSKQNGDVPQDGGSNSDKVRSVSITLPGFNPNPSSPLPTFSELEQTKPVTPRTQAKLRQVSISLPDDDKVYYPSKERKPSEVQSSTVVEENEDRSENSKVVDVQTSRCSETFSQESLSSPIKSAQQPERSADETDPGVYGNECLV